MSSYTSFTSVLNDCSPAIMRIKISRSQEQDMRGVRRQPSLLVKSPKLWKIND